MKTARSLVLAAVGAALVLAPVAAQAASHRHLDARGDLQYLVVDEDGQATEPPQVSANTNGDLVAAKITYTGTSIGVTSRFAGLARTGQTQQHYFEVHAGKYIRQVLVEAIPEHWAGMVDVFDGAGDPVASKFCAPKFKIDYDADTVTVNIPSKCVKSPTSVRLGVGTIIGTGNKLYYDDAFTTQGSFESDFKLSPVVKRN